jgi:hypothetical protein
MSTKNKRIAATLVLVVASLFISIALAEMLLRYIYPVDVGSSHRYRIPHPVFGWVLEPGASYLNKMPEDTVRVTYNSTGWRDIEHNLENNRGAFRILVLGDSFMEGYSVELDDMFHKQIERLAHKENVDMEAINLGVGGYGTLQEYLVFRDIGQHYKPQIVLLGFYISNDVKNNSLSLEAGSVSNTGTIKTKGIKVTTRPFLVPTDESTWTITQVDYDGAWQRYLAAKKHRDSFVRKLVRQSALIQTIKRAKNNAIRNTGNASHNKNGNQTGKKKRSFGNYCKEDAEYTAAWQTTKRIFDRLKNKVSSNGAELFVFTVPAQHEVLEEEIRSTSNHELISCAYDNLKEVLGELGIGYIDLLPSFREISRNGNQNLFRRSDRHWNEEGHYMAAEIVYKALKDSGLFPFVETNQSTP